MGVDLAKQVAALAKKQKVKPLADALGKLVVCRLAAPKPRPAASRPPIPATPAPSATPRPRSAPRRGGRAKVYIVQRRNDARYGTFRHYMLKVILVHNNTRDAEAEHAKCDNPKFANKSLDFAWAAKEGYIVFA